MKEFKYTAKDIYNEVVDTVANEIYTDAIGQDGPQRFEIDVEFSDGLRTSYLTVRGRADIDFDTHAVWGTQGPEGFHRCKYASVSISDWDADDPDEAETYENAELAGLVSAVCDMTFFGAVAQRVTTMFRAGHFDN